MLKPLNRLTKDKDFDNSFKNGRSAYDKIVGIKVVLNNKNDNRFGILISTKISKKAVDRNKIKRQIREIIKTELPLMKTGYDCVVITMPLILGKQYGEIKASVIGHFKKLNLYRNVS